MEKKITLTNGYTVDTIDVLTKIATYLYVTAAHESSSGNWSIYFNEIEGDLELPQGFLTQEVAQQVLEILFQDFKCQVVDCYIETWDEAGAYFDITLYGNYISGWTEGDPAYLED